MAQVRALRILTFLTTALATPLLIGTTVASFRPKYHRYYGHRRRHVTTFCFAFIPLALTAAASVTSLAFHRRRGRMPNFKFTLVDLAAGLLYLAMLIPIWAVEISALHQVGVGLLVGYTTAPMIVNMFVHFYLFLCQAKFVWSWLFDETEHECPNCRSRFTAHKEPEVQQTTKGGEGYSLLRGEDYLDEDAVAYTDVRTSEEQVGVEGKGDVEDKGKGSIKL